MRSVFHSVANRIAATLMKVLFGYCARIYVLRRSNSNHHGPLLLAANHISHFDPFIISSVIRRKIDWMAMAEFFPNPILRFLLLSVDAFPADRDRADRKTIRTALDRLKQGRIVGIFPEGGIRDGARSILEGAELRSGAATLAHISSAPILPCVIVGSDRLYAGRNWLPLRRVRVWVSFGNPIYHAADLKKEAARERLQRELAQSFVRLYAELRQKFALTADDLPHPPRERMRSRRHFRAASLDSLMCASMNLLQLRRRTPSRTRAEMEEYLTKCEQLSAAEYYATSSDGIIAEQIDAVGHSSATWPSPIKTAFPANDVARADFFPCDSGWKAPTVLILHALMSASTIGYRRWAARLNSFGWNVCFAHLPYHYSRVPRGYWNGELAITADLIRNAEGLRQGVIEVRQVMAGLRQLGCTEFGVLGTSYGGWIGALLAMVERDFRFVALMAPIVNVEHAIWESSACAFMRRQLRRQNVDPQLVARHFHLSSPLHNQPVCPPDRILFAAGEFDRIARLSDIEAIHEKWRGSELLRVRQGHFGYRMLAETVERLKARGLDGSLKATPLIK